MKLFSRAMKGAFVTFILLISTVNPAFSETIEDSTKGTLTVQTMTQGQLLWLKGRVGDGYYVGRNQRGESCRLKVPVAIGQYTEQGRLSVNQVEGVKIVITSQQLNDAILNGKAIRSDEWVISPTYEPTEEVDGYIVSGISSDEGFALNAKRRWVSWLLDDKNQPVCR